MKESNVLRSAWLAVAALGTTVFRINTGKGYVSGGGKPYRLVDGSVVVPNGRPIALGFADPKGDPINGTSDLCGWTTVVVTAEMVGHKIAVFTSIETKESGGGVKSRDQKNYLSRVIEAGGIGGFANSADAAVKIVTDYFQRFSIK